MLSLAKKQKKMYLSANSRASGFGGGITKHTPGTMPSMPWALIIYNKKIRHF